jgi:hypothetical protein
MLVIVTNHYKEDLNWLKKSKWPVVVVAKEGADPTDLPVQYTVPNRGYETSSYLKYIVENYDNLPDHVAFIHGHETAWHQCHDRGLLEVIEGANIEKHGFISLNNLMRWLPFANEDNKEIMEVVDYWFKIKFPVELTPPPYFMLRTPIGAQFIVSKERIQRHPKETWQGWLDAVLEDDGDKKVAIFFENVFHIIFGEFWRLEMHDDWFNFKPVPLVWFHDTLNETPPIDFYSEKLFNTMTLEQVNERLKAQGWRWN